MTEEKGKMAGEIKAIPPDGDINRFTGPRGTFTKYISGGGRDGSSMRNSSIAICESFIRRKF